MAMQYANIKLPLHVLELDIDNDVLEVLEAVTGSKRPYLFDSGCWPAIGSSSYGPYEEGDIIYWEGELAYQLSYDFMPLDEETGRLFRYESYRFPYYDGRFEEAWPKSLKYLPDGVWDAVKARAWRLERTSND